MTIMQNTLFRSEWKYICTDGQVELIRSRLNGLLMPDPHAENNGTYQVHSLYFDDYRNSCAAGNEAGDGIRYKYRIRYYGKENGALRLERKMKRYGAGDKRTCPISPEEYRLLLSGDYMPVFWNTDKKLLKEFCTLMMTRLFSPKAIIDYERIAFTEVSENIRITLDRNISAANDFQRFLDGSYIKFPIQHEKLNILEVKFDHILPDWLKNMLESLRIQQTTFSKYYLGRKQLEVFKP